jgi:hypothetical protein
VACFYLESIVVIAFACVGIVSYVTKGFVVSFFLEDHDSKCEWKELWKQGKKRMFWFKVKKEAF